MPKKDNKNKPAQASPAPKVAVVTKNVAAKAVAATPIRNTAIPKAVATAKPAAAAVGFDQISKRAYEISQSPACGSDFDNWLAAERELRGV